MMVVWGQSEVLILYAMSDSNRIEPENQAAISNVICVPYYVYTCIGVGRYVKNSI